MLFIISMRSSPPYSPAVVLRQEAYSKYLKRRFLTLLTTNVVCSVFLLHRLRILNLYKQNQIIYDLLCHQLNSTILFYISKFFVSWMPCSKFPAISRWLRLTLNVGKDENFKSTDIFCFCREEEQHHKSLCLRCCSNSSRILQLCRKTLQSFGQWSCFSLYEDYAPTPFP